MLFASCKSNDKKPKTQVASVADSIMDVKPVAEPKAEPKANWEYEVKEDKMDSKKSYYASCTSTNKVYFDFPYEGGSTFTLLVRNMNKTNEVLLFVSKGQFQTDYDGSTGRIKFDDEEPFNITYTEPDSGSSTLVFLHPEKKIIQKLKTAKKVTIETRFFQDGKALAEFDVSGLEWSH